MKGVGDSSNRLMPFRAEFKITSYLGEFTCHQPTANPHTRAAGTGFSGVQNSVPQPVPQRNPFTKPAQFPTHRSCHRTRQPLLPPLHHYNDDRMAMSRQCNTTQRTPLLQWLKKLSQCLYILQGSNYYEIMAESIVMKPFLS